MKSSITTKKYDKDGKLLMGFTLIELIVVMAVFLFIIGAAIGIFFSIIEHQKRILAEQELLNQVSYVEEYMSKAMRMAKQELYENCLIDSQNNDHPGYIYLLTHYDGVSSYQGIKFINPSNPDLSGTPACQEFFLNNGVLEESKYYGTNASTTPIPLTPTSIHINSIKFAINGGDGSTASCNNTTDCPTPYCCGASDLDSVQPRVTILMNVNMPGDIEGPTIACSQTSDCIQSSVVPHSDVCDLTIHECVPTRTIETTVSQRDLNVK